MDDVGDDDDDEEESLRPAVLVDVWNEFAVAAAFTDWSAPVDADVGIRFGFCLAFPLDDREWAYSEQNLRTFKKRWKNALMKENPKLGKSLRRPCPGRHHC